MAKELTLNLSIAFNKGGVSTMMQTNAAQFDVTGSDYSRQTMSVPTTITALPLGAITAPGYCMMQSRDTTNYVDVFDSVSGNATVRLKPGEAAVFRLASTAPAVKAHTAAVKIEYLIIAD